MAAFSPQLRSAPVKGVVAMEGVITIPTYPWGPDDVNPRFYELEGTHIYPYPMQDYLSQSKVDRTYKALILENEYLRVTCLPELGGRIHSVLDKTENKEMFHLNRVIKPGLIAMRGAWIAGGIEWNRGPEGHTVTDVSPVDALTVKHEDGSVSLVVGTTEQNYRTRWTVDLRLYPGKAYLDERIRIFNPTDGVHSYYFWNNTAFPCKPGTRFIYPMTLGMDHSAAHFFKWPINEGRDLTWLKNYPEPTSVFAYECEYDFFGAYDVDADRGIVDYADHRALPGKKAWTWGQADAGLVSQKALTDEDGPYIEVQSGPLPTQGNFGLLLPRQEVAWQEWWYPVHGLGDGFEFATKDVAVQTRRFEKQGKKQLELRILATGEFPNAAVKLSRDGAELLHQTVTLTPRAPRVVTLANAPDGPIEIAIAQRSGEALAAYTTPLPIPVKEPPAKPDAKPKADGELTADERYARALEADKHASHSDARSGYEKALEADPKHIPSLKALGVLDLEAGLYESAAKRFDAALQLASGDGWAWYWLGAAKLNLKDLDGALECASKSQASAETAAIGHDLAGRAAMRKGDYAAGLSAFEKAVELAPRDTLAQDHRLLALYALGRRDAVLEEAGKRIDADTLAILPRIVLALQSKGAFRVFADEIKKYLGEREFELQEAITTLMDLGLNRDALTLAEASAGRLLVRDVQLDALSFYYVAYLRGALKMDDVDLFQTLAGALSSDYVFPSRAEMIPVLLWALERKPGDAKAHLYLGNLYAGLGRLDDALPQWSQAAELDSSLSVAYRSLGLAAWKKENDLPKAEALYRKAIAARADDQVLYRDLANILIAESKRADAVALLESLPAGRARRGDFLVLLAKSYVDEGRVDDAIRLLETERFSNWENNTETWQVFSRAHVERGKRLLEAGKNDDALADFVKALSYPESLGVGRAAQPQEAEAWYWKGKALTALGQNAEAQAAWKEGAGEIEGSENQKEYRKKCQDSLSAGSR